MTLGASIMRIGLALALCLVGAGLGGCFVTSEQPLFAVDQAPKHPMRDGLWAVTGPGCEVKPLPAAAPLPECVGETMTVAGPRLSVELVSSPAGGISAEQFKTALNAVPSSSGFVLVDGDPDILELLPDPPKTTTTPPRPTAVSYASLRSLEQDATGRIVRGVLWILPCPDKLDAVPGFKPSPTPTATTCRAETPEAVRAQAPHMKPFMSFFVTWVR